MFGSFFSRLFGRLVLYDFIGILAWVRGSENDVDLLLEFEASYCKSSCF